VALKKAKISLFLSI